MKKIKWLVAFLIVANLLWGVIGCKDPESHIHTYSEAWTSDANGHWHAATCEHTTEVSGKAEHTFGDWKVTQEPTEEAEGSREKSCTVCEYTVPEVIEKLAHTHKFATDWTKDETHHWYASTCGHEVTEVKTAHTFGDWTTTKEPTCTQEGKKTVCCTVCEYEKEETMPANGHTLGIWEITKEPTEEAEGSREKSCTVCEYTVPEVIEKLAHTHKFATDWTKDETNHWHAATCGHTTEVSGKAAHSFGEYVSNNDATTEADGTKTRECSVCGHKDTVTDEGSKIIVPEGFVFVNGTTITGTESWTPSSSVFVSERSLTIPDLIVSDHEVTRGEYKAVMGKDPSTASAYDKEGNKLTGDAVLNNPVNYVNWYDAIVYCNKLSMQENLTPCYRIDGSTDPDDWGEVPTSSNSIWNAATCDFEANGYRLPTEAEWEWLARGGENYEYAGSDNVYDVAWYTSNTNETGTREVKTKAPNGYGLYDMSGNVHEWCWDRYGSISSSSAADGAASGNIRVRRGGSWCYLGRHCRVANRGNYGTGYSDDYFSFGFRVVRPSSID